MLLASLSLDEANRWFSKVVIKRYTPRDANEPARKRGYAFVDQELEVGLRSLGVPILNKLRATIAGVVQGPQFSATSGYLSRATVSLCSRAHEPSALPGSRNFLIMP